MTQEEAETGQSTGTKDKDYNLIWFVEQSLSNALRLESYIDDAERDGDNDLAEFFRRAQGASRKGGQQGQELLRKRFQSAARVLAAERPRRAVRRGSAARASGPPARRRA